jgi:formylglycine-generating enzyme required for sulfatase activity
MLLLCLAAATLTRTALGQEPVDTIGNKYFIFFPNIMVPIVLANIDLTIVNPPDGSSAQSVNTYFSWSGIPGSASEFRWIVKLEANDSSPDVEVVSDLTHIEVTLPRLAQNTTYFWQVFGIDNYGRTASSHVASFTTDRVQSNPNVNAMVHVPAGEFRMGCDVDNLDGMICHGKDLPLHAVWLDGYFIDKYEVTNAEYRSCVLAGACSRPRKSSSRQRGGYFYNREYDDYPVLFVSNFDGADFCRWDGGKRLPTEAEWEKAARGHLDNRIWPWGNDEAYCGFLNFTDDRIEGEEASCNGDTVRVGLYPDGASIYGAMDMSGNVFEWVADIYKTDYYSYSPYYNPQGPLMPSGYYYFGIRGGSYRPRYIYARTTNRHFGHHGDYSGDDRPYFRNDQVGFRCALSEPR